MNPESWNAYDSLGEAMLAAGKTEKARALYEKSVAMNPDNENGKKMLAKIDAATGIFRRSTRAAKRTNSACLGNGE